MYQFALIKMLYNTKNETFHPIFYYDSPLLGGFEKGGINDKVIRYKSKGHHTTGFKNRAEAVESALQLQKQLIEMNDTVLMEIEELDDLIWNEDEIPTDIQLRPFNKIKA